MVNYTTVIIEYKAFEWMNTNIIFLINESLIGVLASLEVNFSD